MKHCRILLVASAIFLASAVSYGQEKTKAPHFDDISLMAGTYMLNSTNAVSGVLLELDMARFYASGFGMRTGFRYAPLYSNTCTSFGVPLEVAYRSGTSNMMAQLRSGLDVAARSLVYHVLRGGSPEDVLSSTFATLLSALFNQTEFFAGVTPGFVAGPYDTSGFALTLDFGAALNINIKRVDLRLKAGVSYNVTDNFRYYDDRWFIPLSAGLTYHLPMK